MAGNLRVSTAEQAESGAGLQRNERPVSTYAARTGLTVGRWCVDEAVSGSVLPTQRPAPAGVLATLADCRSGVLLVAKVDRIARKASDLLALRNLAEARGWALSAADG
ncbi:MAG TPA: recombinase family protein [Micromonosporaceae bacterium]|nr:recombinase family protein [Micromonosporaceae bacterium]